MSSSKKLYDEYLLLKKYVPDARGRLKYVDHFGEKISFEIINVNRSLAYFVASKEKLAVKNRVILKQSLYESLQWRNRKGFIPKILEFYTPLHTQAVNSLLKWALSSPSELANRFSKLPYVPKFLIYITIPAVFSYFSSKEASLLALGFYKSLCPLIPIDSFIYVVSPFFHSACSIQKFSRALFNPLFFSASLSPMNDDDSGKFAQQLINLVAEKLPLLPEAQHSLLRYLSTKWENSQIWDLLINNLILPQLWIHFNISAHSYSNKPPFDFNNVHQLIQTKSEIITFPDLNINNPNSPLKRSIYDICESFSKTDEPMSIYVVMTPCDIVMLRHLFDGDDEIPLSIRNLDGLIADHFDKSPDNLLSAYNQLKQCEGKKEKGCRLFRHHINFNMFQNNDENCNESLDYFEPIPDDIQTDDLHTILEPFCIKIFPKFKRKLSRYQPKPLIFTQLDQKKKNLFELNTDPEVNDSLQLWQNIITAAGMKSVDPVYLIMKSTPPRTGISLIDQKLASKCDSGGIEKFRILCLTNSINILNYYSEQFEILIYHQLKATKLQEFLDQCNECIRLYSFLVARDVLEDEALHYFTKRHDIPPIDIPENIQVQIGSSPPSPTSCSYLERSLVKKKKKLEIDSVTFKPVVSSEKRGRRRSFVKKMNSAVTNEKSSAKASMISSILSTSISFSVPTKKNWLARTHEIPISDGSPIFLLSSKFLLDNFFKILDHGLVSTSSIIRLLSSPRKKEKKEKNKPNSLYSSFSSSYIEIPISVARTLEMMNPGPKTESFFFGFKNYEVSSSSFFLSLLMISKIEKTILLPFQDEINEMNGLFVLLTEKAKKGFFTNSSDLPSFDSRVVAKCFWDSCNILCNVDMNSSLVARTFSLFAFLVQIDKVTMSSGSPSAFSPLLYKSNRQSSPSSSEMAEKLIKFAITQGPDCFWVVVTVIVLNSTIFGDERINKYIDEEMTLGWQGFTVALLKAMQDDAKLVALYGSLATSDSISKMIPKDV